MNGEKYRYRHEGESELISVDRCGDKKPISADNCSGKKLIVAVDECWGMARNGNLLAHIPGDLAYFKKKTLGNVLIMGRKTLDSLPGSKPLPGRHTIVLSHDSACGDRCRERLARENPASLDSEWKFEFVCAREEIDSVLSAWRDEGIISENTEIFVAGGEMIYRQMLHCCDEYLITIIKDDCGADQFFPNMDEAAGRGEVELISESEPVTENGYIYTFRTYKNCRASGSAQLIEQDRQVSI